VITYTGFVSELRRLIAEAKEIRAAPKMETDPRFRKWRNELEGVLSQINQVGFLLPCPVRVESRTFGYTGNDSISQERRFDWYQTEMDDTINELELIVTSYQKHGEPPRAQARGRSNTEWPEKITLSWLYQHAPIRLWVTIAALVLTVFGAGVYVGQNEIYRKAIHLLGETPTTAPAK